MNDSRAPLALSNALAELRAYLPLDEEWTVDSLPPHVLKAWYTALGAFIMLGHNSETPLGQIMSDFSVEMARG